jgi:hypothetical protein
MLIPIFFGWPFLIARSQKLLTLAGRRYVHYALIVLILLFSASLGVLQDFKNISSLSQLLDYYPDFVKCMDRKTKERQLQNGLSLYWYAKHLSMLSKNNLHVVQVNQAGPGLLMKHWINNLNWYNNDFEFVIADEVSEAFGSIYSAPIIEGFGEPAETFSCENKKVLVYNRKEDEHFQKQFKRLFSFEFYAAQLPSNTGRMYGLSRIASEETAERGALTYGPYLDLLIGDYYFEIHYFAKKNDSGKDVGKWDILMHLPKEETKNLKEGTIDREGNNTISGVFKVRNTGNLEIRTHYKDRGILRVDKIKIKRIR